MPVVSLDYIEVDDHGVAKLIGTRAKVRQIAIDTLNGLSPEQIREAYPHLSLAQIHAALAYYYDHKAQIDTEIEASERFVDEIRAKHPNRFTRDELVAKWKEKFPGRPLPVNDEPDAV